MTQGTLLIVDDELSVRDSLAKWFAEEGYEVATAENANEALTRVAEQAFYVKCDDETNPSEFIEVGQLTCEIGLAVVKPAEFVVFRLAQLPTGTSVVNE